MKTRIALALAMVAGVVAVGSLASAKDDYEVPPQMGMASHGGPGWNEPMPVWNSKGDYVVCPDGERLMVTLNQAAHAPNIGEVRPDPARSSPGIEVGEVISGSQPRCPIAGAKRGKVEDGIRWVPER